MNKTIEQLNAEMKECRNCRLCEGRINVICGSGIESAPIMLIGEAPGAEEEKTGIPFVGRSGKLLTSMLENIGVTREKNLYITNTLKCRPPENRNPKTDETKACRHFLDEQIKLHNPEVIILVGNFATKYFLGKDVGISKVHGQFYEYESRTLFPVYHPAALLRQRSLIPVAEKDFDVLKEYLIDKKIL